VQIEVDQSGKIGDTKIPTILAFSNDESFAILIPAVLKRECIHFLRNYYRRPRQPYMKMFAAALFLLLQEHLSKADMILIDIEYTGHEGDIKAMLLGLIRNRIPDYPGWRISFKQIGKDSSAHRKAYDTYTNRARADRIIKAEELLCLLK